MRVRTAGGQTLLVVSADAHAVRIQCRQQRQCLSPRTSYADGSDVHARGGGKLRWRGRARLCTHGGGTQGHRHAHRTAEDDVGASRDFLHWVSVTHRHNPTAPHTCDLTHAPITPSCHLHNTKLKIEFHTKHRRATAGCLTKLLCQPPVKQADGDCRRALTDCDTAHKAIY